MWQLNDSRLCTCIVEDVTACVAVRRDASYEVLYSSFIVDTHTGDHRNTLGLQTAVEM